MQISTHILLVSSLFWFLRDLGVHVLLTIYNSWQKQMEEAWMADFLLHHGHAVEKEVRWAWDCT